MRCSNCSHEVKPVVAIDIDGTLGDYHGHFARFAEGWLGVAEHADLYNGAEPYREWFCRTYGVDVTTFRSIKLAYRQGGMKRTMPVFPHAAALTADLMGAGAEVWLTTTRPWDRYDRVDPDTRAWLDRRGIRYHGLLYDELKMDALAERVDPDRVCFVLDDDIEVLHRAESLFPGSTVLKKNPYNDALKWLVMVGSLEDAKAVAAAQILDWDIRTKETR